MKNPVLANSTESNRLLFAVAAQCDEREIVAGDHNLVSYKVELVVDGSCGPESTQYCGFLFLLGDDPTSC